MDLMNIERVMEKIAFPEEAKRAFRALAEKVKANDAVCSDWLKLRDGYIYGEIDIDSALEQLRGLSERLGEPNEYGADMLFFLDGAELLERRYLERGIAEEILWASLSDLRCKLYECMKVKGCYGTFVAGWYEGFFRLRRFALGRLQFEKVAADSELYGYSEAGLTIGRGDVLINMHIPSSGPLTRESRLDAYRRAYEFYADERRDGRLIFRCSSWLLYPPYEEVFGEQSNVVSFMRDFTRIFRTDCASFGDAWRVFGADANRAADELPRETRMQRAFADWIARGGSAGGGIGVFVYPDALEK